MSRQPLFVPVSLVLAAGLLALGRCAPLDPSVQSTAFLNLADTVRYVGMQTCRSCHANIYDTYIRTGMGRSWRRATPNQSDALFDSHALVYDSLLNYWYAPFFRDSILYIREFRLAGRDTVHNRVERVDWIVGSGHHTNSHILNRNGYIYQAPITFYTQDGRWDLAPGFEGGANSRFDRVLNTECVTCHNHYPDHVPGSENRFTTMPEGIECERCHGPGSLHVQAKLRGEIVDTSRLADLTIVNPRRLPRDRITDLCQRCHLQGIAVLQPGKTFFDFKPGMVLSDVMNVFLPRYSDSDARFLMASQADRLRQSACYRHSPDLTCTTCHHPHVSVRETGRDQYNQPCRRCHDRGGKAGCTAPLADRKAREDDCAACHMPPSGSIDIPHVRITDHYIRKDYTPTGKDNTGKGTFLGLESLTQTRTSPVEMAEGYLALFDKFVADPAMLDSASEWLGRQTDGNPDRMFKAQVHLRFNQQSYGDLAGLADSRDTTGLDGWTAYRLGESCLNVRKILRATQFLERATHAEPYNLDFREKYGLALGMAGRVDDAKHTFRWVLSQDPARPLALTNLGYLHAITGDLTAAEAYYRQALKLDPDFVQARENLQAVRQVNR